MTGHSSRQTDCPSPAPSGVPALAGGDRPALRAVMFDMDGLLVDSEPYWFEVETAVMARLGGPWGPQDQRALLGGSLERSVSYMLAKAPPDGPLPSRRQVARWLLGGMLDLIKARGLPLLPGARELLTAVSAAGIPHGLVTSSQRVIMQAVLTATGVRFPVTVCGEDVAHTKPHPEPYLRAAALLGQNPGGCVALEDSLSGVASAQAAGCVVVAVPSVPIPASPGRIVVGSLREVSLSMLQQAVAATQLGP